MSSASGRRSAPAAPTKGLFSSRLFCSGGEVASVLAAATVLRSIVKTGWLATGGALAVAATLGVTAAGGAVVPRVGSGWFASSAGPALRNDNESATALGGAANCGG